MASCLPSNNTSNDEEAVRSGGYTSICCSGRESLMRAPEFLVWARGAQGALMIVRRQQYGLYWVDNAAVALVRRILSPR